MRGTKKPPRSPRLRPNFFLACKSENTIMKITARRAFRSLPPHMHLAENDSHVLIRNSQTKAKCTCTALHVDKKDCQCAQIAKAVFPQKLFFPLYLGGSRALSRPPLLPPYVPVPYVRRLCTTTPLSLASVPERMPVFHVWPPNLA